MNRAQRFARLLRILHAVLNRPGLSPALLAGQAGISQRTLSRDLAVLRGFGYSIRHRSGYQLQGSLALGPAAPLGPVGVSAQEQLARLIRGVLPAPQAALVEADLEALAAAVLARELAATIERRVESMANP